MSYIEISWYYRDFFEYPISKKVYFITTNFVTKTWDCCFFLFFEVKLFSSGMFISWFLRKFFFSNRKHFFQLSFFFNPNYQCPADEIRNYQKTLVAHFGLQNHIRLNTGVKRAVWDQDKCIWIIETDTSESLEATHLISGCGVLRTANIPNFKENECPSNYVTKKYFW